MAKWVKIVSVLIIASGVLLSLSLRPQMIMFWEFTKEDIVRLFTELIIIALIIERAIEVLLTPWREGKSQQLIRLISEKRKAIAKGKTQFQSDVTTDCQELEKHKDETRRQAFLFGLALGTAVSAIGIRTLGFQSH